MLLLHKVRRRCAASARRCVQHLAGMLRKTRTKRAGRFRAVSVNTTDTIPRGSSAEYSSSEDDPHAVSTDPDGTPNLLLVQQLHSETRQVTSSPSLMPGQPHLTVANSHDAQKTLGQPGSAEHGRGAHRLGSGIGARSRSFAYGDTGVARGSG